MDIENIFKEIIALALNTFSDYKGDIEELLKDFYKKSKSDIEKYTIDYTSGKMSKKDYEFLLRGKQDLLVLASLEAIVKSKVKAKELQTSIMDFIIEKLFLLVP